MSFSRIHSVLRNAVLPACILGAIAGFGLPDPTIADTRSCHGTLRITPQNASMSWLAYDFSVARDVNLPHEYNPARRDCRTRMIACVRSHWANPGMETRPEFCIGIRGYHVNGYPFENLEPEVTEALCAANPDAGTIVVGATLTITGERGCVQSGAGDTLTVARNVAIFCTAPIGDSGSDEAYDPPEPIGDAGGWECVGEGCEPGDPPADAPEDAPLPTTASYQLLPLIRLPGNDLYMLGGGDGIGDWMDCRQACTGDARCRAWTYRAPTNRCLIKARPSIPIPDGCCRSGIKQ